MSVKTESPDAILQTQSNGTKRMALFVVYLAVLLFGVALSVDNDELTFLVMNIFLVTGLSFWIRFDARRQSHALPSGVQLLIYLFWPLAVPVYLVWTRGIWRGGFWTLCNGIAMFATWMLGYNLMIYFRSQ